MSIGLYSWCMLPIFSISDAGTCPDLTRADGLDANVLRSIRQKNTLEIHATSDKKLTLSGSVTLHRRMDEPQIHVKFDVVDKLVVNMFFGRTYMDMFVKLNHWSREK